MDEPAASHKFATGAIRIALLLAAVGCGACRQDNAQAPPAAPPPEVSVIRLTPAPVTVTEEYVGRTDAMDVIEIRARVGGILERQAFTDGAFVHRGDLLYVLDEAPFRAALTQARANLAQAQANLVNAQENLARQRRLVQQHLVSRDVYDTAVATANADRAVMEAQRAAVEQAQINLGYTTLRAPRDGVMSRTLVRAGSLIKESDTQLATLYSVNPMAVYFSISEERWLKIQKRDHPGPGTAPADATSFRIKLADGSDYRFAGKLDFVDPAVDQKTGTLQARLAVPNPDGFLRAGQFVRVIFPLFEYTAALRVPEQAVQELQGLKSVLVVGPDGKVASRRITAGNRAGQDWVVEKGLEPGEQVIVEGTQKARPGMTVKPVPAAGGAGSRSAPHQGG